jgi:nitrous oxide reductase accessory protein NosL
MIRYILFLLLTLGVIGCQEKSKTAVTEVHWDRDMCARCVMVVSDRHNTTQVRNPQNGKTYMFDDIGCMVLWFRDHNQSWKDQAKIWITDVKTGKWIDAREAFYDTENITPMAYGFSAHEKREDIAKDQEIIDFDEVVRRVLKVGK